MRSVARSFLSVGGLATKKLEVPCHHEASRETLTTEPKKSTAQGGLSGFSLTFVSELGPATYIPA